MRATASAAQSRPRGGASGYSRSGLAIGQIYGFGASHTRYTSAIRWRRSELRVFPNVSTSAITLQMLLLLLLEIAARLPTTLK